MSRLNVYYSVMRKEENDGSYLTMKPAMMISGSVVMAAALRSVRLQFDGRLMDIALQCVWPESFRPGLISSSLSFMGLFEHTMACLFNGWMGPSSVASFGFVP